ncbi:PTPLA-domain-containing protein [Hysterangium stoloniferum]|nr:PTPLA-domain-containing protein [Hysterangium stoloniferum]
MPANQNVNKPPSPEDEYLVIYNVLSALGWSYVFYTTCMHLASPTDLSPVAAVTPMPTAKSALPHMLSSFPLFQPTLPQTVECPSQSCIPPTLLSLFDRAKTTYAAVGWQTAAVQSFAFLEVIHCLLGWVRSPIMTTAAQVASRLILVWGIAYQYEAARHNPFYASMVLSWSITEVIRYSFYAANKLQSEPKWLLWLRYSTFYILYPTGAGSEAFLIFSTIPSQFTAWNEWDSLRASMFFIWWPGLYVMYTYMIKQRRKVLRRLGGRPKTN